MFDRKSSRGLNDFAGVAVRPVNDTALLLSRVCWLTIFAVVCTALGTVAMTGAIIAAPGAATVLFWVAFLGALGMLFLTQAVADRFPLNIACLALFAGLEGAAITPLILRVAMASGPVVILQAAALSVLIFAMVGTLGYTSARSYANWLPWLMGGVWALLIGAVLMWFIAVSDGVYWLYSVGGTVLFTAFIFVDFTRIRHDYSSDDYVPATINVYLDLLNLFLFVLRLLGGRR